MSDTIWLEVTDGKEKTGGDRDNTILLKLGKQLDALAEKLGVAKPSSFYDNSALADEYAGEFDEAATPEAATVWFEARAGREAMEALLTALREQPDMFAARLSPSRSHWPQALLEELEYCHSALVDAEQRGHRFHLLIVP
jgi:hypothetical protein